MAAGALCPHLIINCIIDRKHFLMIFFFFFFGNLRLSDLGGLMWLEADFLFFFALQSYTMYSDHKKMILTALSVTFFAFSPPGSLWRHISVTSQITVWKIHSCFTLLQKLWRQVCRSIYCRKLTFESLMVV